MSQNWLSDISDAGVTWVLCSEGARGGKKYRRTLLHPRVMRCGEITLDIATKLLEFPRELGNHPETNQPVILRAGRYGPYVQMDEAFASLRRDDDLFAIGLDRAVELLAVKKPLSIWGDASAYPQAYWCGSGAAWPLCTNGQDLCLA